MTEAELTEDERRTIASLKRLAKKWPCSLILASMDGELVVMHTDGRFDSLGSSLDRDKVLAEIKGIHNTGGAW